MNALGQVAKLNFERPLVHATAVFLGFGLFYTVFFAPGMWGDRVLAFDDGLHYFLPAYYAPPTLWTDALLGGYPIAADPQNMTWYPVARLLSGIPGSWNGFFVLGYVLAASFAYCYAYTLTTSRLASVVAGLIYSLSGVMVAHMSVMGMIHAAAWIPLLLCALERLRHRPDRRWRLIGVVAFVCCFLGGHPQVSVYGIGLGVFYAVCLGWGAPIGRWRYYRCTFGLMAISLGICAIQLVPAIELSRLSLRAALTPDAFFAGSLPGWQAFQYIFPFLFGSDSALPPYRLPYWGKEANIVDISTYVGILPLTIAVIGLATHHRRGVVRFWLGVGVIAFGLIFGRYFGLAQLIYHVPIYNAFRIPARHSLELALAVSVLASFGVVAIQRRQVSPQLLRRIVGASLLVMLGILGLLTINAPQLQRTAALAGIQSLSLRPWENAVIGVPIVIFGVGLVALVAWYRWPRSGRLMLVLLMAVTIDLGSFAGWFYDLADVSPHRTQLAAPLIAQKYQQLLAANQQRLVVERGIFAVPTAGVATAPNLIFPNLTRLWSLPLANGYSPLMLSRVSQLMQMAYTGSVGRAAMRDGDRGFDLMAVKYLLSQSPGLLPVRSQTERWSEQDLALTIGAVAGYDFPKAVSIDLPSGDEPTTAIGLVTALGNAVAIPDKATVVQLQVVDERRQVTTYPLLAGRDTAEFAYDCPDTQPQMQHRRAKVFQTITTARPGIGPCPHQLYQTIVQLDRPRILKQLRLQWQNLPGQNLSGNIMVQKLSLLDRPRNTALPIEQITPQITKWREVDRLPGGVMYENRQALPRAWVVPTVRQMPPEAILQTIQTSQLPDGAVYQPETIALVESIDGLADLNLPAIAGWTGQAQRRKTGDTAVEVQTNTPTPALLVLSDVNYPGWQAWVDGQSAPIVQTNYVQRGVKVPAGEHTVRFEFHPLSFKLGVGISVAAVLYGIYWLRPRQ
jgi:Bacterial membrane protein YfhO